MNLTKILRKPGTRIYFIGIKGVGMTMLAQFLTKKGFSVSGSDNPEVFMTDKVLRSAKIKVYQPFSEKNIPAKPDLIVYSIAYNPRTNAELAAAFKKPGVPVVTYAEAAGEVFSHYYGVAVCGTHGKTTITAWLGYVLSQAGLKPNVLAGARVPQFKGSGLAGASKYLIAEADEYYNKLKYFSPRGVILTSIDYDHPDYFKTEKDYIKVFAEFVKKIPPDGFLIANEDDVRVYEVSKNCRGRVIFYSGILAENLRYAGGRQQFALPGEGEFSISLLGKHNIANALAVIYAALELGADLKKIRTALPKFTGTERRAQILGKYRGAIIMDDYAHHPTEIKATLAGVRAAYPKKNIITVFHPHTYTRTKALLADFARSFADTDELIVLDIYGSARETQGGVTSVDLVDKILENNVCRRQASKKEYRAQKVKYIPALAAAAKYLAGRLKKDDLALLMGAGDVFRIGEELLRPDKKK